MAHVLVASLTFPGPLVTTSAAAAPLPQGESGDTCADDLADPRYPAASVAQSELWPPNHALVNVGLNVDPGPRCEGKADVSLAVYSDEPDDAKGDGSFVDDAQLDPPELYLRRERQGGGDGRVYLIVATASFAGVTSAGCATVVVPHSRRKSALADVRRQAQEAQDVCQQGGIPSGFHLLLEGPLEEHNQPPTVDAGPDQGIDFGAIAFLDGTVEDDGLPSGQLQVAWTKVDGPGDVTFTSPSSEDTEASFTAAGAYVLALTASDGALSASAEIQVIVEASNQAPVVDAGPDVSITLPAQTVRLVGSVTDDGRVLPLPTVQWSQVSGPGGVTFDPPTSADTMATFPGDGVFDASLDRLRRPALWKR